MVSDAMTLREHLDELRKRLMFSLAFVILAAIVAFVFRDQVLAFLLAPGGFGPEARQIIATEVLETVSVTFKVTLMVGFAAALPVILYQVIMFVSPGLTGRERFYLFMFLPGVLVAFAAGVAFGYYVLFPPAFEFLFNFGAATVDPQIRIASYMNVLTSLMFWMGVVFQIPIAMFGLARLGVVTPQRLGRFRRFAIVIAFVAAAMITPTFDPVNQTLVAMPMLVLYELGIVLARLGTWMRRPRTEGPGRLTRPKARLRRLGRKVLFWKRDASVPE